MTSAREHYATFGTPQPGPPPPVFTDGSGQLRPGEA